MLVALAVRRRPGLSRATNEHELFLGCGFELSWTRDLPHLPSKLLKCESRAGEEQNHAHLLRQSLRLTTNISLSV